MPRADGGRRTMGLACGFGMPAVLRLALLPLVMLLSTAVASAAPATYALFRLDPLGVDPQAAEQLEALLRAELGHVVGQTLPSKAIVDKVALGNPRLQNCTASPECLAPLGRALHVTRIVAGNVGGLADSYIVNLKLVDDGGRELSRVSATLRGSLEELIAEIRVAAVRLVAPEQLVGRIEVVSAIPGAQVTLDGNPVGVTPLLGTLDRIPAGTHKVTVSRDGYSSFEEDVPVRFEKTTQVVVRQTAMSKAALRAERRRLHPEPPVYARWYTWTAVAVGAVGVGLLVGFLVPKQQAVDCSKAGSCP
ncbi:MAG: PEGA domain-containing protein [Polyangia bacterium]